MWPAGCNTTTSAQRCILTYNHTNPPLTVPGHVTRCSWITVDCLLLLFSSLLSLISFVRGFCVSNTWLIWIQDLLGNGDITVPPLTHWRFEIMLFVCLLVTYFLEMLKPFCPVVVNQRPFSSPVNDRYHDKMLDGVFVFPRVVPGDSQGQQATRHLRRRRASFSAPQMCLPVPRHSTHVPVFIQWQHPTVPGETPVLSVPLLSVCSTVNPPVPVPSRPPAVSETPAEWCWTMGPAGPSSEWKQWNSPLIRVRLASRLQLLLFLLSQG